MPDSGPHRGDQNPRTRGRQTIFAERDEAIFTLALLDAYPDMTFTSQHREMYGGDRPCTSIALSDSFVVWARVDRGWAPDFYLHITRSYWSWGNPYRGVGRWAWDPPTLGGGGIGSSYMPGDDLSRLFIQRVWRIIERISTNRVKRGHPLGNEMMDGDRTLMADVKYGDTWCGHQALSWAREGGNRRMLEGSARPCDDWDIPRDKWYRDLVERAMQTDGWNAKTLGGTPPEDQTGA
jgi:hypothetical protein